MLIRDKPLFFLNFLKSEYHASDPLHACVSILCLHSVVPH